MMYSISIMSEVQLSDRRIVVIKKGTDILTSDRGKIKTSEIRDTAEDIHRLRSFGMSPILVASGATTSGMGVLRKGGKNNIDLHNPIIGQDGEELPLKQALASIGQPELLAKFSYHFIARGIAIGQVLVNHGDFEDPKRAKSTKGTIQTLLALGAVPILNGNDPTSPEGFYYDNDMITADTVVATGAKLAIMYTSVGGFTVDGQVIPKIGYDERDDFANFVDDSEKSDNSSGGMESKLASISRMTDAGATVHLVGPYHDARLANIISGSYTGGTRFLPAA